MSFVFRKAQRSQVSLKLAMPKLPSYWTAAEKIIRQSVPVDSGCWNWLPVPMENGYGMLSINGKRTYSHRASYEAFNGPIPAGLDVRHTCDNRRCVKPGHLILGTRKQNMEDCVARGRINRTDKARGEAQHLAKLTADKVRSIRARLDNGETCAAVAVSYGVTRVTINAIKNGRTWAHV